MHIHVDEIGEKGLQVERTYAPERMPMLTDLEKQTGARYIQALTVRLNLTRRHRIVAMHGQLQSRMQMPCSRCLQMVQQAVQTAFELYYTPEKECREQTGKKPVVELTAEDLAQVPFDGEVIDPFAAVQEEAVAALPAKMLCAKNCKGLCTDCGTDLNLGPCRCQPRTDPRFAILAKLKKK